jgi:methylmalonyl-CoA mutase, C-terminal domain
MRKKRILITKVGLDGHVHGAMIVAKALRDAGAEIIYCGFRMSPEKIVATAIEEDVDAIGVSILSGAHMALLPKIIQICKQKDCNDIPVFAGGVIPHDDIQKLKEMGIKEVFPSETEFEKILTYVKNLG